MAEGPERVESCPSYGFYQLVIAWVFDHNAEPRNALLTKIVERCLVTPLR